MPQVNTVAKSRKDQGTCGKCGKALPKGTPYRHWSFRYGGKYIRCMDCKISRGELTQSKLGPIYDAQDEAAESVGAWSADEGVSELQSLLSGLAETVQEAVDEYTEAAEHFGGQGENQERAEELEGYVAELESAENDLEEFDEDGATDEIKEELREKDESDLKEGKTLPDDYEPNANEVERMLTDVMATWGEEQRDKASDAVDACPL